MQRARGENGWTYRSGEHCGTWFYVSFHSSDSLTSAGGARALISCRYHIYLSLKALFKVAPESWIEKDRVNAPIANPRSEEMASRFARELDLTVPLTVQREVHDLKGTLHVFVDFKTHLQYTSQEWQKMRPELQRMYYDKIETERKNLFFFDYLIKNYDAHSGQQKDLVMFEKLAPSMGPRQGFEQVGFDYGAAFQTRYQAKGKHPFKYPEDIYLSNPSAHAPFLKALENRLTESRIRELMSGVYSEEMIQEVIASRTRLIQYLSQKTQAQVKH